MLHESRMLCIQVGLQQHFLKHDYVLGIVFDLEFMFVLNNFSFVVVVAFFVCKMKQTQKIWQTNLG